MLAPSARSTLSRSLIGQPAHGATHGDEQEDLARQFLPSIDVGNPKIGGIDTAYAVVFREAFTASASTRAAIASKMASFACSTAAMA